MYCQVSAKSDFLNFSQFFSIYHFFSLFLTFSHFFACFIFLSQVFFILLFFIFDISVIFMEDWWVVVE